MMRSSSLALLFLAAFLLPLAAAQDPSSQEEKTAEQPQPEEPPQERNDLEEHRTRFSDEEADAGMLAIGADELIKRGEQEWLRARLFDEKVTLAGVQAIISAFTANKEVSIIPEILKLSVSDKREAVLKSCSRAITHFLEDASTRDPTIQILIDLCKNESDDLVLAAISTLGKASTLLAVKTLIPFVQHQNTEIRQKAVQSLKALTYRNFGQDQAAWEAWWEENEHLSRDRLIEPVLNQELKASQDESAKLREQRNLLALQFIESNPERAVEFLSWDVAEIRHRAAEVISGQELMEGMQEILDQVIAHLEKGESDEATLKLLLRFIGRSGVNNPAAQAILLKYLGEDGRDTVKVAAAESLHRFKNQDVQQAGRDLLLAVKDTADRNELKESLLELLAIQGCGEYLELIEHFLDSNSAASKGVRQKAVRALGASGESRAIEILERALVGQPETDVRKEAASSLLRLGGIGSEGEEMKKQAVAALQRGLVARDSSVKIACIIAIGELKPADGLTILREYLLSEENDPGVLQHYVKAIGWLGDPEGIEVIASALPLNNNGGGVFAAAQTAVDEICGEDPTLWAKAVEIFFAREQHNLTIHCCDFYINQIKGKNGDDETLKQVKIRRAESCYARYTAEGELQKALEHARSLTEDLAPENSEYLLDYARILVRLGKYKEAADAFQEYLNRNPAAGAEKRWQVKLERSRCFFDLGNMRAVLTGLEGVDTPEFKTISDLLQKEIRDLVQLAEAALAEKQGKTLPKQPEPDPAPVVEGDSQPEGAPPPDGKLEVQAPEPEKPKDEKGSGQETGEAQSPAKEEAKKEADKTPPADAPEGQ
ncbi:MAG: HEAT repeat domain-containing protein [Planctomycetota bacterium]